MTTRIRINAEGQITETRPVNAIRILGQNKETEHYSNDIIAAQGCLPESLQIKGGWLIPVYDTLPEGAKPRAEVWRRDGLNAIQTITSYQTAEEVAAQAQADYDAYIASLAPSAQLYAQTLRLYFPDLDPPAEQNQAVTEAAVMGMFLAKRQAGTITAIENADSLFLATMFGQLKNEAGNTWELPWSDIWKVQL